MGPGYEDLNLYGDIVNIGGVDYSTIPSWHFESDGPPMDGRLVVDPFVFPGTPPRTLKLLPQPENNVRDFYKTGVVTNNSSPCPVDQIKHLPGYQLIILL